MDYYGIKRVRGKGYENRNVVFRKRKRADLPFFFFLCVFGAFVYLVSSLIFRSAALPNVISSFSILL